jgi:D-3-phosphoglycerate dehydrogenase / 2-oxoglutarate reductase
MHHVKTLNNIAQKGLDKLDRDRYTINSDTEQPDALILRSYKMHDMEIPPSVTAIARAGAGTNNIPIEKATALGIPVFNTPGANANAVKELVLTGLLLACRNICSAWDFARNIEGDDTELTDAVEKGKKQFAGIELPGRTLGIIGLGAIGVRVANAAIALGMKVKGYDPSISVENAWQMSSDVEHSKSLNAVLKDSDFITVHVPLNQHTKGLLNADNMPLMKEGVVLLNFARGGIIDREALHNALQEKTIAHYVTDFPSNELRDLDAVISLPHLGASTVEAEENCAVMAAEQIKAFLEEGTIKYSVNFPVASLPASTHPRLAIVNHNVPNMVAQMSSVLSQEKINILDMVNTSRDDIAYTLLDTDKTPHAKTLDQLAAIDGVVRVRLIK